MTEATLQGVNIKELLRQILTEGGGESSDRDAVARKLAKALPKRKYRLLTGTHRYPNPDFTPESVMMPEMSHLVANPGDIVELTDDQYRAFRDRFAPLEEGGTNLKDADAEVLENAKKTAAKTGEMVDPNQLAQPLPAARDPLREEQAAAARAAGAKKG